MVKNPFFQYKLKKEAPNIIRTNAEEIERIKKLDLSPDQYWLYHTRNMFMFSLYCAGIRVGDLLQLTPKNVVKGQLLQYKMEKVKKARLVALTKPALEILQLYNHDKPRTPFFLYSLQRT